MECFLLGIESIYLLGYLQNLMDSSKLCNRMTHLFKVILISFASSTFKYTFKILTRNLLFSISIMACYSYSWRSRDILKYILGKYLTLGPCCWTQIGSSTSIPLEKTNTLFIFPLLIPYLLEDQPLVYLSSYYHPLFYKDSCFPYWVTY